MKTARSPVLAGYLITATLAIFAADSADGAGGWHGRRSPKNAAVFHSMDGPGRAAFHVISGPVRAGEDENRGRCDALPLWLIDKAGKFKSGHVYILRIDEGQLTGVRHKRKNLSLDLPSPCAPTEDLPVVERPAVSSIVATAPPVTDCNQVDCAPDMELVKAFSYVCGGLEALETSIAKAPGKADHHLVSPYAQMCRTTLGVTP